MQLKVTPQERLASKLAEATTALGEIAGTLTVLGGFIALKAWLLVLVLGWFGVTALGFWQAVVVVVLLDLLINSKVEKK